MQEHTRVLGPFTSEAARQRVLDDRAGRVAALHVEVEAQTVATRFGDTRLLVAGPPGARPVLALHGLNVGAARNLSFFLPLTEHFRLYAPDTPSQLGASDPADLRWESGDYATWVHEVLDGLGFDRVTGLAVSFGAAMLLQAATLHPHRFKRASLVVPAGIVPVDLVAAALRLAIPATLYRFFRHPMLLRAHVSALATEVRPDLLAWFDLMSGALKAHRAPPPVIAPAALRDFRAPVQVIAARRDLFFPVQRLCRAARATLSGLADLCVLAEGHIPSLEEQARISARVIPFLHG